VTGIELTDHRVGTRRRTAVPGPVEPGGVPAPGPEGTDAVPDQGLPAAQQVAWPAPEALAAAVAELRAAPGLVLPDECDRLRERLALVAEGGAVLLQGGDCAEAFDGVSQEQVTAKFRTLGQMAAVISEGAVLPVVTLGRMAGQYAKPRSSPSETRDGVTLPAYRGDLVNGVAFTAESRTPDARRLMRAHRVSATTLNLLRALAGRERTEFWTSHEALVLDYERALTRTTGYGAYSSAAHMVWIGERTRQLDRAHIDFVSRIRNPVGVKLGPTTAADDVLALIDRLDPKRLPGRLTLIARMGAKAVRDVLPDLVEKVTAEGARVVWMCDPMHGNTFVAGSGHKTRRFADILDEVRGFFEVHQALGTHPGGIHAELTGEHVTECLGGTYEVTADDLPLYYETACDPRLNRGQSLDLAEELAALYSALQRSKG